MSDEMKKTVLSTLAEPLANSAKNITDKPTQNMGTTFADIWYLVFGDISQAAEKRKIKYAFALQEFEKELQEKISKIPKDKLIEPNIQIVAPALEASKYCIEHKKLREMFSNYISSSMSIDTSDFSQPMFIDILKNLKPLECKVLDSIYKNSSIKTQVKAREGAVLEFLLQISISLNKLNAYGLTKIKPIKSNFTETEYFKLLNYIQSNQLDKVMCFFNCGNIVRLFTRENKNGDITIVLKLATLPITPLGLAFKITCID